MTIAVTHIAWKPCLPIIPSRFPSITLFDRVTETEDLKAIFELAPVTNLRHMDEAGDTRLVSQESGSVSRAPASSWAHLPPKSRGRPVL